ncbi:hypothetical protein [Enterococcus italicus]|uniref:hypothetical protein n=1 Tax=Enterococcus italicus TaxID=246144 RepID=UPI003F45A633
MTKLVKELKRNNIIVRIMVERGLNTFTDYELGLPVEKTEVTEYVEIWIIKNEKVIARGNKVTFSKVENCKALASKLGKTSGTVAYVGRFVLADEFAEEIDEAMQEMLNEAREETAEFGQTEKEKKIEAKKEEAKKAAVKQAQEIIELAEKQENLLSAKELNELAKKYTTVQNEGNGDDFNPYLHMVSKEAYQNAIKLLGKEGK